MNAAMNGWSSAGITDVGKVRKLNEDAFLDRPDLALWVVADGMGGHSSGEVASQMVCAALASMPELDELAAVVDFIDDSVIAVNAELVHLAQVNQKGSVIGSTVVSLAARGRYAACLWAGDSRIYRLRGGVLEMLSDDHSLLAESGREGDAESADFANVITRAVGASDQVFLDVDVFELIEGDRFLLCSDGLSRELSDTEIACTLMAGGVEACSQTLVDSALRAGGGDNITAIVADYRPDTG